MDKQRLKDWIEELIAKKQLWKFYKSKEWITLKEQVLKDNHYECAECKKQGIITRHDIDKHGNEVLLSTVHHVQFVRKHPALALSRTYTYNGKTYLNLIPVCKSCHNKLHPEKKKHFKQRNCKQFINEERW